MTLYNITIFSDLKMEEDVTYVTTETGCKYYCYAQEKFLLFQNQICVITIQYKETVHLKPEREKEVNSRKSSQAFRKRQHQYRRKW